MNAKIIIDGQRLSTLILLEVIFFLLNTKWIFVLINSSSPIFYTWKYSREKNEQSSIEWCDFCPIFEQWIKNWKYFLFEAVVDHWIIIFLKVKESSSNTVQKRYMDRTIWIVQDIKIGPYKQNVLTLIIRDFQFYLKLPQILFSSTLITVYST